MLDAGEAERTAHSCLISTCAFTHSLSDPQLRDEHLQARKEARHCALILSIRLASTRQLPFLHEADRNAQEQRQQQQRPQRGEGPHSRTARDPQPEPEQPLAHVIWVPAERPQAVVQHRLAASLRAQAHFALHSPLETPPSNTLTVIMPRRPAQGAEAT